MYDGIISDINNIVNELYNYQAMTQQVLNYIMQHQEIKEVAEILSIIKEWGC